MICSSSVDAPFPLAGLKKRLISVGDGSAQWQPMAGVSRAGVRPIANFGSRRTKKRARAAVPQPCLPASPPKHSPCPLRGPRWVGGPGHAQSGVLPLPGPGHRLLERFGPSPGKPGPPDPPSPRSRRPNLTDSIPAAGTAGISAPGG